MTATEITRLEQNVSQVKSEIALARSKFQAGLYDAARGRAVQAHSLFYAFASRLLPSDANALEAQITAIITASNAAQAASDITWYTRACSWVMDKLDSAYDAAVRPSLYAITQPVRDLLNKYDDQMATLNQAVAAGRGLIQAASKATSASVRNELSTRGNKLVADALALQREIQSKSFSAGGLSTGALSTWLETIRSGLRSAGLGVETATVVIIALITAGVVALAWAYVRSKEAAVAQTKADAQEAAVAGERAAQAEQKAINDLKVSKSAQLSTLRVQRAQMAASGATASQLAVIDAQISALEKELRSLGTITPYEPPGGWFPPPDTKGEEQPWYAGFVQNVGWVVLIGVGAIITVKYILPEVKKRLDARRAETAMKVG